MKPKYKFQLPATGPLSAPLVRSYIRNQIITIRKHYRRIYFKCNINSSDGVLCFPIVYTLIKRSGSDIKTYIVLSFIIEGTGAGKHALALKRLDDYFRGVIPVSVMKVIIQYLRKIQYIKQYYYNPYNPSGPAKHIVLTGKGIDYYKLFLKMLTYYFLDQAETSDMPQTYAPRNLKRLPRINHNTVLQNN